MARTPDKISAPADGRLAASPLRDNPTGTYIILLTIGLLGLGVVLVQSAVASVRTSTVPWYARQDTRHAVFAVLAALMVLLGWRFDYRRFLGKGGFPWPAAIVLAVAMASTLLVYAPGIGHAVATKYRWIRLGSEPFVLSIQPSELVKLAVIIFMAAWLSHDKVSVKPLRILCIPVAIGAVLVSVYLIFFMQEIKLGMLCALVAIAYGLVFVYSRKTDSKSSILTFAMALLVVGMCTALIIKEDFGTAAIIGVSAAVTMLLAGVRWYFLGGLIPPAAAAFYFFVVNVPYRWERVEAMMNPWGVYQSKQALIAIGSGGWLGHGLGQGSAKLGYLPVDSTDYIYSILCNDLGFIGGILLVGMLVLWLWNARNAAVRAGDRFGQVLAGSLGFVIGAQALLHIAVNLAQVPPKGIGLPFVSAGGTSMVILAAAVALIVSVTARRHRGVSLNRELLTTNATNKGE